MNAGPTKVVGIDIGGSKTHALVAPAARSGNAAGYREAMAGGANLFSVGADEAGRQLTSIFDQLGRDDIARICVGAAGIDTPAQEERLRQLIATQVPQTAILVVHDTRLILAAADVDAGIALIAGTGSVAWGCAPDGRSARAGGWGYLLGDEGSGYWIVRQAVRHILALADAGEPLDPLALQVLTACGVTDAGQLLGQFYTISERRYWAGLSTLVFDLAGTGDRVALDIVTAAAASLCALVHSLAARLHLSGPVVLGGGLLRHQPLLQTLVQGTLSAGGHHDVRVLHQEPVYGALNLARRPPTSAKGQ